MFHPKNTICVLKSVVQTRLVFPVAVWDPPNTKHGRSRSRYCTWIRHRQTFFFVTLCTEKGETRKTSCLDFHLSDLVAGTGFADLRLLKCWWCSLLDNNAEIVAGFTQLVEMVAGVAFGHLQVQISRCRWTAMGYLFWKEILDGWRHKQIGREIDRLIWYTHKHT